MSDAFNPTALRPDAPAMPMHSHEADGWNNPVPYAQGLTARQHAAIAICIPDSGCDWLDAMIEKRRRDEFAAKAMVPMVSHRVTGHVSYGNEQDIANRAYELADAMLAASKKPITS